LHSAFADTNIAKDITDSATMDGEVVRITRERTCSVSFPNEILVIFPEPDGHTLKLGDRLRFPALVLDQDLDIENLTQGTHLTVRIASRDAHDLRLPMQHGKSRTPSKERLSGK
jgi:hypothetical protein